MEEVKNCLMNADIAFENKQYPAALGWYQKALELDGENLYALSRAGAICVSLAKFSEAQGYFEKAKKLDPENGDNYFNCGSAWFFQKDNVKAFEMYVQAEKIGCSEDVPPQLYYQMAMICSMRQDHRGALTYFRKCQDSDPTGALSLRPDLISEKLKLYMLLKDFQGAETCAAQLVAISPADFRAYMTYYSILMGHGELDQAEKVLRDAERYAELKEDSSLVLAQQRASLYMARGTREKNGAWFDKAVEIMSAVLERKDLTARQYAENTEILAEFCVKAGKVDRAMALLNGLLRDQEPEAEAAAAPVEELTREDIELMMWDDMERIQAQIDAGELDGNMGAYAYADYDEMGNLVHYYDWNIPAEAAEKPRKAPAAREAIPEEIREKATFTLLNCLLEKENFADAYPLSKILKHSRNSYFSYFGRYAETMLFGKLSGMDAEQTVKKYAETGAFFRSRSAANPGDSLAAVFRARLYAEQKKFHKAEEISQLLAEGDRQSILAYIEQCRKQ